jgi:putative sigma-54 modulation protein
LREHAEHRLRFGLTHASDHIRRVEIRLSDINGPCGGADKRCSIVVTLESFPEVVIVDIENDLYVAIARAADRASRSVARRLERCVSITTITSTPRNPLTPRSHKTLAWRQAH